MKTISIIVSGKVQGVFYRQSTKEKAIELKINGTVKNLDNGDVQIVATGVKEQLNKLTEWCWQGSPKAAVTNIEVKDIPLRPFDKFSIERF